MTQTQDGDAPVPDSEKGYDHSDAHKHEEPVIGETTERQPAWSPVTSPAGKGIYSDTQATSTGTNEEPEGPGI